MQSSNLEIFEAISLEQMDEVSLMKRVDTKFVVNQDILPELLASLKSNYRILEIGGNRMMTYDSTYFDTRENDFYLAHHNKRTSRVKVRIRNYVESNLSFLEVKLKNNKGLTVKKRIKISQGEKKLNSEALSFIEQATLQKWELNPKLTNKFNRFTLASTSEKERVTFDLNLDYNGVIHNQKLAIIELKQERLNRNSTLFKVLKCAYIHPYSISKYCIGMAILHPDLKQNIFKHKLLTLNKITS